jgi:hypothetical protein
VLFWDVVCPPESYRVNFEVPHLKPFSSLAFPALRKIKIPPKQPGFGDELVTSSPRANETQLFQGIVYAIPTPRCAV